MKQDQIEKHSTAQSVILHLLPGILVGCFLLPRTTASCQNGVSLNFCSLSWHSPLFLFLSNSDSCLYQGKKKTGRFTLTGESSVIKTQSRGGNTSYG